MVLWLCQVILRRIFCRRIDFLFKENPNKNYSAQVIFLPLSFELSFFLNMNDSPRNHLQNSTRERSDAIVRYDHHVAILGTNLPVKSMGKRLVATTQDSSEEERMAGFRT
jgi:hypothetical protein